MTQTPSESVVDKLAPLDEKLKSAVQELTKATCAIPPVLNSRNQHGLIDNGFVNYAFTPEGMVDWRKMINPKHLTPNKQYFERFNKPVPKSVEGLEDKELIILLGGIKELAQIRGYDAVHHFVTSPSSDYVVSVCSIMWIPNYETEGRAVTFSAIGDASPINTNNFGRNYLGPIAENRAFVRAVRNFLKVNIVSQEELGAPSSATEEVLDTSSDLLVQTMKAAGVDWEKMKKVLLDEATIEGVKDWNSVSDIPKAIKFDLVARLKKKIGKT